MKLRMMTATGRGFLRTAGCLVLGAVWMVALPSPASAAPYEPNDTFEQAVGPLKGGTDYNGKKETANDKDYFYFNVRGQRQLDISFYSADCIGSLFVYDADGNVVTSDSSDYSGVTFHLRYTTPHSVQYGLQIATSEGCTYKFRIEPGDAITDAPPGAVIALGPGEEPDDLQRVYVDGVLRGSVQGSSQQIVDLGLLSDSARITFDAENTSGSWSWKVNFTNQTSRLRTTVFSEEQAGGSADRPRIGFVRHVVMSPTGGFIENCGEAIAPVVCIDTTAPSVSRVSITPRFARGSFETQGVARESATRRGATILYTLTETAIARLEVRRETKRVKVVRGSRIVCVPSTLRSRRESRRDFGRSKPRTCSSIYRRVALAFTHAGVGGQNMIEFTGLIAGGRALLPGRYRLYVRATDPAGNTGRYVHSNTFRVVRR